MPAIKGLGTTGLSGGTVTPLDHKLAQSGLIAKTGAGSNLIRPGLFYDGVTNIVLGKANMSYDVVPFTAALSRGAAAGTVLSGNPGLENVVTTAAPGSNSRIDVVYIWQREASLDGLNSDPVIGVVQGTAAVSPTVPSLAAFPGAIELARITVPAGVTATNSGTTITQTAPFTTLQGGVLPFRSVTERAAATVAEGQLGWLLDSNLMQRFDGTSWGTLEVSPRIIPSSATNGSVSASGVVTSTAQPLVRVRDAFPAGFTMFRVHFDVTMSAAVGVLFRLAVDATDAATGYDFQRTSDISTAVATVQDLNQAQGSLSPLGLVARHVGSMLISSPNLAVETLYDASSVATPNPMTTSAGKLSVGGQHRTATAYNSLTLFGSAGNITINRLTIEGVA